MFNFKLKNKMRKILSFSLLAFLLLIGTNAWGIDPGLSDFTWPTPIVDEDFTGVANVSATSKVNPASTSETKHGAFNGLYNNNTANTYGIESTVFSSSALFLTSGSTTSPIITGITGVTFGESGAFSFKCRKTNVGYIGLESETINGTAYAKANAFCYLSVNNGTLKISNGTSWKDVTTYSTDNVEICVIYNNSASDLTYGNAIAIAKQTAHVYVNGTLVKDGSNPKAMSIVAGTALSFRVVSNTSGGKMNVDNIKIYDELPTYKVPVTISAYGWSTFSSDYALDFSTPISGLKAYEVREADVNTTTGTIAPNEVTSKVSAHTGLLLQGTANTEYSIPVVAPSAADDLDDNKLVGVTSSTTMPINNSKLFVFTYIAPNVAFAHTGTNAATVDEGKAYLDLTSMATLAPSALRITDEENNATSLEELKGNENSVKFIQNGQLLIRRDGITYDMVGRIVK